MMLRNASRRFHRLFVTDATAAASASGSPSEHPRRQGPRHWPLDRRGEEVRTAKARRLGISTSDKKLNMVARLVRGLSVREAEKQLVACRKKHAAEVASTIQAAVRNAHFSGLRQERLVVDEAFVGKGKYLKRLRPWHGKGRWGVEHKKYAHLTVKVRELDEELWEAKVMPQYVHMQYRVTRKSVENDRNHPIHQSDRVSYDSQLDLSLRSAKESVQGLRDLLTENGVLEGKPNYARADERKGF